MGLAITGILACRSRAFVSNPSWNVKLEREVIKETQFKFLQSIDMTHAANPANSALLAQSCEISGSEKVRGGPGRSRTCGRDQGLSAKVRQLSAFEAQRGFFTRVAPLPFHEHQSFGRKERFADNRRDRP